MKKFLLIILILVSVGLLTAWWTTRPAASAQEVLVAAGELAVGHVITGEDLSTASYLPGALPNGAFQNETELLGKQLRVARAAGDVITAMHLGTPRLPLAADERAVGVEVTDSGGLAGVLQVGDRVGVTAVMLRTENTSNVYSKVVANGLRVVYVSPTFRALELDAGAQATARAESAYAAPQQRSPTGTVNLAVPVDATVVSYVFAEAIGHQSVTIGLLDLLPALDHATDIELSLFLEPEQPKAIYSAGIYVPDLIMRPGELPKITPAAAMTPTPTVQP